MRVVLDTNILVSGLLFGGLPKLIIDTSLNRGFTAVSSITLIKELQLVLAKPKFKLDDFLIEALTTPYLEVVEIVNPKIKIEAIERCPADNRVLECAVCGKCNYIVTGDRRDLLSINSYEGIPIVSPKVFVNHLKKLI